MGKLAYEKAHADIVKYDNSDLLQTRSGSDDPVCSNRWQGSAGCYMVSAVDGCTSIWQIDQGMPDPTL